jgi:UDP-N-acetylglucosamine 2-epimerase (non-hydrolysing)
MKILNIVGARPNFMKVAPLMRAYAQFPHIEPLLVHTGQHYDPKMSQLFFEELGLPRPDFNLEVGSGTHADQTARIMIAFERLCLEVKPDWVLVVGDVNSTIACALVASKLGIRIAHVEAGLRSNDRTMPEEINRILTDAISDLLFVSESSGLVHLGREGVDPGRIHFVGNVMIDSLLAHRDRAEQSDVLERLGVAKGQYALLTLHRPSNVDHPETLLGILEALRVVDQDMPIVFPAHPRTVQRLAEPSMKAAFEGLRQLKMVAPLGYLEFVKATANAGIVLTDSGGVQEETAVLHVPCLTLRENTERPVTCTMGTNRLVGTSPARIIEGYRAVCRGEVNLDAVPPLWDGKAADRVVEILASVG